MANTITMDELMEARGVPVYDSAGEKIGSVEEIFYDEQTGEPEWIGIGTGFLGTKRVLVPVQGASLTEDRVTVPYDKERVKDSPDIDVDEIDQDEEQSLYSYYGLQYSERRSESGLPEGGQRGRRGGAETVEREGEVTRAEEELRVGKRPVERGSARLRKWVETEPVQAGVDLQRERARVTREPVDRPAGAGEIGEQEVEVTLRGEEPVVQKETVARERVGLEKDVETERETITDEVRKERVEVEGDVEERNR